MATARGLVVRVGRQWIQVPVQHVGEVIDLPPPTRLPAAAEGLEGVVAVRGTVLPVWRADRLLGVAGGANSAVGVRLVTGTGHLCLLVDEIHGLLPLDEDRGHADGWWTDGYSMLDLAGATETVTVMAPDAVAARASA